MSRRSAIAFLICFALTAMISGAARAIMAVPSQEGAQNVAQDAAQGAAQSKATAVQQQAQETYSVRNVLVEKIDGNVLYAKDGSTYPLTGLTVVDNSKKGKIYAAELTYIGGTLKRVMLK